VLFFLALPLIIYLSFKQKYKESIPARFFLYNNPPFKTEEGLWFHVCSLGEARALKPLLTMLNLQNVKITTITQTGQNEAKKYRAEVRYLPYESYLPFWIKSSKVLVVLEAEFWYLLFRVAYARGAKIILLNARISDKSVDKYIKFAWFYKKLLTFVDTIYAQSEVDRERFLALGAKSVEVIGNIKLAGEISKTKEYEKPDALTIVAGSTHDGEEDAVLEAFLNYKKFRSDAKLIIVPRHPERFEAVYELIKRRVSHNGLSYSRFSDGSGFESDVVLVDMMGELNNIYAISDVAVLGGAFRDDIGGHNPLEPAFFGCKIITGKHFFHQKELFRYVQDVQYVDIDEIENAFKKAQNLPASRVQEKINLEPVVRKIKEYI